MLGKIASRHSRYKSSNKRFVIATSERDRIAWQNFGLYLIE